MDGPGTLYKPLAIFMHFVELELETRVTISCGVNTH